MTAAQKLYSATTEREVRTYLRKIIPQPTNALIKILAKEFVTYLKIK